MTKRILSMVFFALFAVIATINAQDDEQSQDNPYKDNLSIYKYKKSQGELGIHGGHLFVAGDVSPELGWAAGIHYRHAIDYALSWRLDLTYGQARGIEPEAAPTAQLPVLSGAGYDDNNTPWYPNYRTNFTSISLELLYSLNAHNFSNQLKRWNIYFLAGVGVNQGDVQLDALNDGKPYDFSGLDLTKDDGDIKKDIGDILDRDYETNLPISEDDEDIRAFHVNLGGGLSYRLGKNMSLSLEHQVIIPFGQNADLYDGYDFRGIGGISYDLINYTSLRVNFDLWSTKNGDRLDPLYWVGSNDLMADDLAGVMQRVDESLRDSDGDGVLDMVDEDPNTPEGASVDTKGNLLDSDRDGVADYEDKEPHSPQGYPVDADGIAQVPDPGYTTEDDVNRIVDAKLDEFKSTFNSGYSWFLPMVNYSYNNFTVRSSEYSKLHAVASVLKQNPNLKLIVKGYTDKPGSDCYNQLLGYNRAESAINFLKARYDFDDGRFVRQIGGETETIIDTNGRSLLNRRVEFMVARDGASAAAKPDCGVKNAGRGKKEYSGNKQGF